MVAPTDNSLMHRLQADCAAADAREPAERAPVEAGLMADPLSLGRGPYSSRGGWPARSDVKAP